jgi:ABC-type branched-subunit amino acid transport system substrate-binding protein
MARFGAALVACLAVAGCAVSGGDTMALPKGESEVAAKPADAARPKAPGTKVALLLPLSAPGQTAVIAKAMKQAAEMAMFELDDPSFELVVKDDKGTSDGARAAASEAVAEKAELILGPLFAQSVAAAAPVTTKAGVATLAFSNDRRVAGRQVHVLGFQADQEVERITSYAAQHQRSRLVALLPDDDYGRGVEAALSRTRSGMTVVAIERFSGAGTAMLDPVRRIADLIRAGSEGGGADGGIDTFLIAAGPDTLGAIGPMITYTKLDTHRVKLIGTGGWDHPTLGRDAAFVGGWFPGPDPRNWQAFTEKFSKTFGMAPPRVASLAYDAVSIAITLSKGPPGTRYSEASLTRPSGFTGIDGPVRFMANGVAERRFSVLEVQSFGAEMIEAAQAERIGANDTN